MTTPKRNMSVEGVQSTRNIFSVVFSIPFLVFCLHLPLALQIEQRSPGSCQPYRPSLFKIQLHLHKKVKLFQWTFIPLHLSTQFYLPLGCHSSSFVRWQLFSVAGIQRHYSVPKTLKSPIGTKRVLAYILAWGQEVETCTPSIA